MRFHKMLLLLPFLLSLLLTFYCKKEGPTQPAEEPEITKGGPPDKEQWKIVFMDDFNDAVLNRSKWDPYYTLRKKGNVERRLCRFPLKL